MPLSKGSFQVNDPIPDHYGYRLLTSLSRHRDLEDLNGAFLAALKVVLPQLNFRIYIHTELHDRWRLSAGTNLDLTHGDRVQQDVKERDVTLIESAENPSEHFSYVTEGKVFVCLFPIRLGREFFAALISDGQYHPAGNRLFESLIDMYSNVYTLLYRLNHDPLTGLLNRESFGHAIEVEAHAGNKMPAHLVIIDIDHFKRINDCYGHLMGDAALVELAGRMINSFRDVDYLFRFGGEEFVILLHDLSGQNAHTILDRFRASVAADPFPEIGQVTVSIGYTRLNTKLPHSLIISHADQALYYAKEQGRNRTCCYEELLAEGLLPQH